jgi:hypothetical protein
VGGGYSSSISRVCSSVRGGCRAVVVGHLRPLLAERERGRVHRAQHAEQPVAYERGGRAVRVALEEVQHHADLEDQVILHLGIALALALQRVELVEKPPPRGPVPPRAHGACQEPQQRLVGDGHAVFNVGVAAHQ